MVTTLISSLFIPVPVSTVLDHFSFLTTESSDSCLYKAQLTMQLNLLLKMSPHAVQYVVKRMLLFALDT